MPTNREIEEVLKCLIEGSLTMRETVKEIKKLFADFSNYKVSEEK